MTFTETSNIEAMVPSANDNVVDIIKAEETNVVTMTFTEISMES
jgi:hypothetical protein